MNLLRLDTPFLTVWACWGCNAGEEEGGSLNQRPTYYAVCRAAPATPDLLNMFACLKQKNVKWIIYESICFKKNLEPDAERGNTNKLLIQTSCPKNLQKNISDIEKHQLFIMINKWKKRFTHLIKERIN